jgi:ABC-type amino acid transport substrate-binding protein
MRFFSVILFLFPTIVFADSLTVGLMDSRPFAWVENNTYHGFHYEVAKNISERIGEKLEVKDAPVMRIIDMLRKGKVDFVIMTNHKDLDVLGTKKEILIQLDTFIYSLPPTTINEIKDLKGPVARLSNSCIQLNSQPGVEWTEVESYNQAYDLLKAKRITAVCGTIAFQILAQKKNESVPLEINSFKFSSKDLSVHALSKFDKTRWKKIQNAIKELDKEGVIESLSKKYAK